MVHSVAPLISAIEGSPPSFTMSLRSAHIISSWGSPYVAGMPWSTVISTIQKHHLFPYLMSGIMPSPRIKSEPTTTSARSFIRSFMIVPSLSISPQTAPQVILTPLSITTRTHEQGKIIGKMRVVQIYSSNVSYTSAIMASKFVSRRPLTLSRTSAWFFASSLHYSQSNALKMRTFLLGQFWSRLIDPLRIASLMVQTKVFLASVSYG